MSASSIIWGETLLLPPGYESARQARDFVGANLASHDLLAGAQRRRITPPQVTARRGVGRPWVGNAPHRRSMGAVVVHHRPKPLGLGARHGAVEVGHHGLSDTARH